ncbi:hypothetical protein B0H19DRAFT_1273664 [Mycena capillaripes]|nr:hypothetical protein B0H19DRAFT_1273664 [Mycena capillaripes]
MTTAKDDLSGDKCNKFATGYMHALPCAVVAIHRRVLTSLFFPPAAPTSPRFASRLLAGTAPLYSDTRHSCLSIARLAALVFPARSLARKIPVVRLQGRSCLWVSISAPSPRWKRQDESQWYIASAQVRYPTSSHPGATTLACLLGTTEPGSSAPSPSIYCPA